MASDPKTPGAVVPPTQVGGVLVSHPPAMPDGEAPVASLPTFLGAVDANLTSPPAMPTLSGNQLTNVIAASSSTRYALQGEIARGGMGRVVEALDTVLGRMVAVKEALSFDADSLARFQRETKITARLEHPSIVPVHDAGTTPDGMPYYVMRKISGRALETLVATTSDVKDRLGLIQHLVHAAQAIAHAHERGIVHRDIKPSNILVGELGETMVIDWGLAKVIGEPDDVVGGAAPSEAPRLDDTIHTRIGIVFGTPGFMAPEQLRGAPVDERCDVYALGATLYHVLSRRPPHHARTADEMMRLAVAGPPTPIGEVVQGVPPELSTIVDKALAQEAGDRYQNARALAADLQRFLTGQLVASHHYTRKEKARRFVKKHLATIVATVVGLVALLAIGTIAVVRIVHERDRAEHERGLAIARADQLALNQARILVDTDPTRAVALLRPLVTTHWREVRAIVLAARASGVAWSIPGSPATTSIELARDGGRAVIAGDDGVVREVELGTHASRIVFDARAPIRARYADADRRVIAFGGSKLAIIELAGGAPRELVVPSTIVDLRVAGATAYWVDDTQALWQLPLVVGAAPSQIVTSEQVTALAPSPDGRWLALAGVQHLLALDRGGAAQPPFEVTIGVARDLAWSADGHHLAAMIDERMVHIVERTDALLVAERKTREGAFAARFTNALLYAVEPGGVFSLHDGEPELRKQLAGSPLGLGEARRETLVAASATGAIYTIAPDGDHVISPPLSGLTQLATSPTSPYVLGAYAHRVLVWNLDHLEPKRVTTTPPTASAFVDYDHAIVADDQGALQWLDLTDGALAGGPTGAPGEAPVGPVRALLAPETGMRAVVVTAANTALLVAPGTAPVALGAAERGGFVDDTHVALASGSEIRIVDVTTRAAKVLVASNTPALQLAWARSPGGWHLAATYPAMLWRTDHAGRAAQVALPASPTSPPIVLADGTVLVALGRQLHAWTPDGALVVRATLPASIVELAPLGAGLIAFDRDGGTYVVDGAEVVASDHALGPTAAMAASEGMIVTLTRDGSVELVDPRARQHFILAPARPAPYARAWISADGTHVLATSARGLLKWWWLLPGDPAGTRALLGALTNAFAEAGSELSWR